MKTPAVRGRGRSGERTSSWGERPSRWSARWSQDPELLLQRGDKDRVFIPATTFAAVLGARTLQNMVYRPRTRGSQGGPEEGLRAPGPEGQLRPHGQGRPPDLGHDGARSCSGTCSSASTCSWASSAASRSPWAGSASRTSCTSWCGSGRREIGIKRSVGARRRDILRQFLVETFLIVGGRRAGACSPWGGRAGGAAPLQEGVGMPGLSPMAWRDHTAARPHRLPRGAVPRAPGGGAGPGGVHATG